MDGELKQLEEELERLAPAGLPDGMISRMEAAMAGWQDSAPREEEKVVPFPTVADKPQGASSGGFWAAAAAVALLGAVIAFLLPQNTPDQVAARPSVAPTYAAASFAPMNLDRNIVQASDGGVVFTTDDRPHRLVRVEYLDSVEYRNAAGAELHVERPSIKFVLIPVQTD